MFGKRQRKEHARLLTRVGMCAGKKCSQMCQRALTQKQTLGGGGALQRGHSAPLERLAQLGDALGGVGAAAIRIEATDLVVGQAASMGGSESVSGR